MKYTYLLIDFFTVIIPLIFSFHPKIKFNKWWVQFFIANAAVALVFICWDAYFTSLGVWSFNENYTVGWRVVGLPIEEILFFTCIPFSCVFTYYSLNKFYNLKWNDRLETISCVVLSSVLLVVGIWYYDRLYTSYTFISTAVLCLLMKFVVKVNWFSQLLTVYAVLLIPFFIVNGLLTGTGLEAPVVMYNDNENLGIRIVTIPVEDIFYGFELVILNVFLFELQRKFKKTLDLNILEHQKKNMITKSA